MHEAPMKTISLAVGRSLFKAVSVAWPLLFSQAASAVDLRDAWPTAASGPVVAENRVAERFHALRLDTGARVVVRQGQGYSVKVQAEGSVVPLIDTYVEDGALVIADYKRYRSSNAEVVVTAPRINSIATTGSVAVLVDNVKSPSLQLSMGGSSAVNLRSVSINRLNASLGGSSALKVSGAAEDFSVSMGGSSAVEASDLAASAVSVNGGGSSQATVWAKESLQVSLGGSSGLRYYGSVNPVLATAGAATVKSLGVHRP